VSAAGTSADDSKEAFDEKSVQPMYQDAAPPQTVQSIPNGERPPPGDATVDKPVPVEAPPVHPNAEVRPLEAGKQALVPEEPTAGPMQVDSSAAAAAAAAAVAVAPSREAATSGQKPNLQIQAPAPVVQQDEDEMIQDRTPEQAARDNDIEMSDSGPSLPLTEQDAAVVVEEEKQAHERRESSGQQDVPPPPARQEQQDGTAVSHDTSMVSTPEPAQKWLLPPIRQELRGRKCLVLDLDETLVHSSFKVKWSCSKFFYLDTDQLLDPSSSGLHDTS
jgi:RNA polymerase II subunit A small phosphatase-like protein